MPGRTRTARRIEDIVAPGLRVLFVGINPGLYSAAVGHNFARPGNRFWKALHLAGITPELLAPADERRLLEYGCGITNLVARESATAAELSADEIRAGGRRLRAKLRKLRPRVVCFLGLGAYRTAFGEPVEELEGARVFVLPNPSGLNAHYQLPALARLFSSVDRASRTRRRR